LITPERKRKRERKREKERERERKREKIFKEGKIRVRVKC